jgi:hypothetical protein
MKDIYEQADDAFLKKDAKEFMAMLALIAEELEEEEEEPADLNFH